MFSVFGNRSIGMPSLEGYLMGSTWPKGRTNSVFAVVSVHTYMHRIECEFFLKKKILSDVSLKYNLLGFLL